MKDPEIRALQFITSSALSIVVLFGITYAFEYYRSFGISIAEVSIGYLEATLIGVRLIFKTSVVGYFVLIILTSLCLLWFIQRKFGTSASRYFACILYFCICYLVVLLAVQQAKTDSERVTRGEAGRFAYCMLRDNSSFSVSFKKQFDSLTINHKMRKILETRTTIYLSPVVQVRGSNFYGQTYRIDKADMLYCRIIGQ